MLEHFHEPMSRRQYVRTLLLESLFLSRLPDWPGADGVTVDEVLDCYREHATIGRVPGLEALAARHPEFRVELAEFFAGN